MPSGFVPVNYPGIKKVLFLVPPQVHLLDLSGPAQIFYEVMKYGKEIELLFGSIDAKMEVQSSAGVHFNQLTYYQDISLAKEDLLIVPGLAYEVINNPGFIASLGDFFDWLRQQYAKGVQVCSICTGSFLLASAGILDRRSATTHWKYFADFQQKFPRVKLEKNRLFVSEGNLHVSAGVSSGIDLSLFLVEKKYGASFALEIAKEVLIYFRRGDSDPQLSIFLQFRDHLDQRIHEAQDFLVKTLAEAPDAERVAAEVNMSKRNLTRLFKKTTGITIGAYTQKLRVERAVNLLADGHKVSYVTHACGLRSPNQLRSLLKKYEGLLPTDIAGLKD